MRVLHTADLHFCNKQPLLNDIIKCSNYLLDYARSANIDLIAICGDLFDEGVQLGSPGSLAAIEFVYQCATVAPTILVRGTSTHDAEGSINPLDKLKGIYPIYVTDQPGQVALTSAGFTTILNEDRPKIVISCMPEMTKAHLMARASGGTIENKNRETGDLIRDVLQGFGVVNDLMRQSEIPTILMGHLTVTGSVLPTGQTMIGRGLEITTGDLLLAKTDKVMLGHIHKAQSWGNVYYSGSITRLNFGEVEDKGFFIHELPNNNSEFVTTPARTMKTARPEGLPGIEVVSDVQQGDLVRVCYTVSEEDINKVDEQAIIDAALAKGAADVKIEKTVIAKTRIRAEGISEAKTLEEKLLRWAETVNVPITREIVEKLTALEESEVEPLIQKMYGTKQEAAA